MVSALFAVNLDDPSDPRSIKSSAATEGLQFTILQGSQDLAGVYNLVYRYLFDRHRNLPLPTPFLIDKGGNIVKVYNGTVASEELL